MFTGSALSLAIYIPQSIRKRHDCNNYEVADAIANLGEDLTRCQTVVIDIILLVCKETVGREARERIEVFTNGKLCWIRSQMLSCKMLIACLASSPMGANTDLSEIWRKAGNRVACLLLSSLDADAWFQAYQLVLSSRIQDSVVFTKAPTFWTSAYSAYGTRNGFTVQVFLKYSTWSRPHKIVCTT